MEMYMKDQNYNNTGFIVSNSCQESFFVFCFVLTSGIFNKTLWVALELHFYSEMSPFNYRAAQFLFFSSVHFCSSFFEFP